MILFGAQRLEWIPSRRPPGGTCAGRCSDRQQKNDRASVGQWIAAADPIKQVREKA